jgi:chromosome segregation ATPase
MAVRETASARSRRIIRRYEAAALEARREAFTLRAQVAGLAAQLAARAQEVGELEAALTMAQARIAEGEEHIRTLEERWGVEVPR